MKKSSHSCAGLSRRAVRVGVLDAATADGHPCRRRDRRRRRRADRVGAYPRQRGRRHRWRSARRRDRRLDRQRRDGSAAGAMRAVGLRLQRQPGLHRFLLSRRGGNMKKDFHSCAGAGRRAVRFGLLHAATTDRHAGRRRDRRRRRRADRIGAYRWQRGRRHCRRPHRRGHWRADRQRRDGAAPPLRAVGLERLRQPRLPRLVLIDPRFTRHGYSSRHGAVPSRPARSSGRGT